MKLATIAGTASFAHLLGRGGAAAAAKRAAEEEETEEERKEREEREAAAAAAAAEEEDDEKKREEEARKKAEEDRKKEEARKKAESEGEDDDDEEGDDGSDGADMRKKGARSARMRERARCAAIFADAAAGNNPALAAQLAFGTDLPRSQAVNVLRAGAPAQAPRRKSLDDRMAAVKTPPVGAGDAAASPTLTLADQIVAAGRKARGEV